MLLGTVITSIGPILVATLSGYFLLRSHHSRVQDELRIRAGTEQLQMKQAAYREIWRTIFATFDENVGLLTELNWRKIRETQTSHLLAGSQEVVRRFYAILEAFKREEATQEDRDRTSLEITRLAKELWNAMRKDLYNLEPLPPETMRFFAPGNESKAALEVWRLHRPSLEKVGIRDLDGLSKIDVGRVSQETGIPHKELEIMKSMANRELRLLRESERAQ